MNKNNFNYFNIYFKHSCNWFINITSDDFGMSSFFGLIEVLFCLILLKKDGLEDEGVASVSELGKEELD